MPIAPAHDARIRACSAAPTDGPFLLSPKPGRSGAIGDQPRSNNARAKGTKYELDMPRPWMSTMLRSRPASRWAMPSVQPEIVQENDGEERRVPLLSTVRKKARSASLKARGFSHIGT